MVLSLASIDVFRKVPRDLTHATTFGGALSLFVFTILTAVFLLETWTYAAGETRSKIILDRNPDSKIQVNFAVSFLELPCRFADIEVWDYLGNSRIQVDGNVEKSVLTGEHSQDIKGKYVHERVYHEKSQSESFPVDSHHVIDVTMPHFGEILRQAQFTFVLYYVDWCGYCRRVLPIWTELGDAVARQGLKSVQIAQIDCVMEASLCTDSKISGYPTFIMFKGSSPLENNFHGVRSVDGFMSFIRSTIGASVASGGNLALKEQWHEGCLLRGSLLVNRVPGNFHVSAKSDGHSFDEKSTNTSHVVHELTFGPRLPPRMLRKIPKSVKDNIDPLAGHAFVNREPHMSHEHYIKIVSTVYEVGTLIGHDEVLGYQMSTSNHQYNADPNVPVAKFSFDLSPTAVVISQAGRRWYEFLTSLCAIIGGMFTVFSLVNGFVGTLGHRVTGTHKSEILSPSNAGRRK